MLRGRCFRVDDRRVVHETIDGETILINLETGTYYSLRGSGAEIWALAVEGRTELEVIEEMRRRYPSDADFAAVATEELLERLLGEDLLEDAPGGRGPASPPAGPEIGRGPFEAPELESYTDMQYFLLLDPIHEVHEEGWPRPPVAEAPGAQST